jgi:hypothetical protein
MIATPLVFREALEKVSDNMRCRHKNLRSDYGLICTWNPPEYNQSLGTFVSVETSTS